MAGLSLQEAADAAGTSKSSIFRALKSGRISGTRTELGGWSIEPVELFRVFPAVPVARAEMRAVEQTVTAPGTEVVPPGTPETPVQTLQLRVAVLEAELTAERRRAEDLRTDRDRWADQAQRLALPAPAAPSGFLGRLFGRKAA